MNGMFASLKIVATIAVIAGLVLLIFIRNIYAFFGPALTVGISGIVVVAFLPLHKKVMSMVRDDKAEKLEQAGLYRRALSRWLIVLDRCKQDAQREWIIKHRAELTENIKPPKVTVDNFSDVTRAATATQHRMGIAKPNGQAFRIKP